MTVPFSEAVARRVPEELRERKEMGDLWAWITFATVNERVEKSRTSPDWFVEVEGVEGAGHVQKIVDPLDREPSGAPPRPSLITLEIAQQGDCDAQIGES